MKRTVKIKLEIEQQEKLQETIRQFKYACNQVVDEGWNEEGAKDLQQEQSPRTNILLKIPTTITIQFSNILYSIQFPFTTCYTSTKNKED